MPLLNMSKNKPWIGTIAVLLSTVVVGGCGFMRPDYLTMLSPAQLQQIMQLQDVLLVDVHIPKQKHLPGTDHHIPFHKIYENAQLFPESKQTPIYLYCESGPMANWAARSLHDLGYKQLYSLEGGTHAWTAAGLTLESGKNPQ